MIRFSFSLMLVLLGFIIIFGAALKTGHIRLSQEAGGVGLPALLDLRESAFAMCIMAAGSFAAFTAQTRQGRTIGWIGLGLIGLIAGFAFWPSASPESGWVLYPPVGSTSGTDFFALDRVASPLETLRAGLRIAGETLALGVCLLAATAVIAAQNSARSTIAIALGLIALTFGYLSITLITGRFATLSLAYVAPLIPCAFIAFVGLRTPDLGTKPATHYVLWAVFFVIIALMSAATIDILLNRGPHVSVYQDTYYVVNSFNRIIRLVGIMLAFAGLWLWFRPSLPQKFPLLHGGLIFAALLFATLPAWWFALSMPRRFIDYPEGMTILRMISQFGTAAFMLLIVVGFLAIVSRRAR